MITEIFLKIPALSYLKVRNWLILCCVFGFSLNLNAQVSDTLKVLFVGNSYTYYQNLPHLVSLISDSTSTLLKTRKSTSGGANLSDHWKGERGLQTKTIIKEGDFDIVVLQEHSLGPIEEQTRFEKYARLLCDLVKENGARPYFYLTWAREKTPERQEILTRAYLAVASQNDAIVVPVGPGWALALQRQPNIGLYAADGRHPADLGTYLASCIFTGVLTGQYPHSLPTRYYTKDQQGESVELLRINRSDIEFSMKTAKAIIDQFASGK